MHKISIEALARKQLKEAVTAPSARAADTVFGGHEKILRQTVIGIRQGAELGEREREYAVEAILDGRLKTTDQVSGMSVLQNLSLYADALEHSCIKVPRVAYTTHRWR